MASPTSVPDVLRRRLAVQRLVGGGLSTATDVVELLGCVQSQEWAHGFWSLGMRTAGLRYPDVQQEFDTGDYLRTHILRPTWHYVAARDIRWILTLTSPRVQQAQRLVVPPRQVDPARARSGSRADRAGVVGQQLQHPPRARCGARTGRHHDRGQRLAGLVMNAELEGLICSGPMRGAQHTYAVLDERVAAAPPRSADEALAELTWRFFRGHGPADVHDFTRWSSLATSDARAGLELVGDRLAQVVVEGHRLWFDPESAEPAADANAENTALLLPLYDEALLSYPRINFTKEPGHPHQPGDDLFVGSVVCGVRNVGTWRRTVTGRRVSVVTDLAPSLGRRDRAAVAGAVDRLAAFLGKELVPPP
jgi:hypothetical protein